MRRRRRAGFGAVLLMAAAGALAAGCAGPALRPPPPGVAAREVTPSELIEAHNAWADRIQHIWSRADILLNFEVPDSDRREKFDLSGHFFAEKPDRLLLQAQVLGQTVFTVGLNPERYWLYVRPEVDTVYVGRRGGAAERRLFVSPEALFDALGIGRIEPDRAAEILDFQAYSRQVVLSIWSRGRGLLQRRIWFDRATLRPARIDVYDALGDRLLVAELMKYERPGDDDVPVCTVYRARFEGDPSVSLVLKLRAVDLEKALNPRIFTLRVPPGATEEDLDAAAAP